MYKYLYKLYAYAYSTEPLCKNILQSLKSGTAFMLTYFFYLIFPIVILKSEELNEHAMVT